MARMVKTAASWVFGWLGTALALVAFGVYLVWHLWPASWWYSVRSVVVFDSVVGADVLMSVDRQIHRAFTAEWDVLVRRKKDDGSGWVIVCQARGRSNYRPDAILPDPLTLAWWTGGQCPTPPAGRILVSTIWTIDAGAGRTKAVVAESNFFTIHPRETAP